MTRKEIRRFTIKNPGAYAVTGADGQMLNLARTEGLTQLRAVYDTQTAAFNGVTMSPFYLFSHFKPDEMTQEDLFNIPMLQPNFVSVFYIKAKPSFEKRSKSLQTLCHVGEAILSEDTEFTAQISSTEKRILLAAGLLSESYLQVDFLNSFNDLQATLPRGNQYLSPQGKIGIGRLVADLGTKKTDNFRESMRRSIPRYMWQPLDYPAAHVTPKYDEVMKDLWSGYSPREAHYLIHPDSLAKGKAPLHMALQAAEEIEIEGAENLGYAIRTDAITTLLNMESKRAKLAVHPEVPFFTAIVAGAITGEVPEARNAHFDYAANISETMSMTLERLQKEIAQGVEDGTAARFVKSLAELYPDIFPDLFARSLVQGAKWSDEADELSLLKAVSQKEFPWAAASAEKTLELSERRLLTMDEVDELVVNLPPQTNVITPEEAAEQAVLLLGEEDALSVGTRVKQSGFAVEVGVDIDANSKLIEATIRVTSNGQSRYVPFRFGLPPVMDSFRLDLLLPGEFKETTVAALQSMTLRAISEAARKKQAEMSKRPDKRTSAPVYQEPRGQQLSPKLGTREERMAAHGSTETRTDAVGATAEVLFDPADKKTAEEQEHRTAVRVVGLSNRNIRNLLDEANIKITSAAFRAKMKHAARLANSNGDGRFGKRLTMEAAGTAGKGIKLYEVKWTIFNEHLSIRGIFRDIGDGRYELVGILNKKGNDQQIKYLTQLIKSIRDSETDQ